jgi:hypothetical protein
VRCGMGGEGREDGTRALQPRGRGSALQPRGRGWPLPHPTSPPERWEGGMRSESAAGPGSRPAQRPSRPWCGAAEHAPLQGPSALRNGAFADCHAPQRGLCAAIVPLAPQLAYSAFCAAIVPRAPQLASSAAIVPLAPQSASCDAKAPLTPQ